MRRLTCRPGDIRFIQVGLRSRPPGAGCGSRKNQQPPAAAAARQKPPPLPDASSNQPPHFLCALSGRARPTFGTAKSWTRYLQPRSEWRNCRRLAGWRPAPPPGGLRAAPARGGGRHASGARRGRGRPLAQPACVATDQADVAPRRPQGLTPKLSPRLRTPRFDAVIHFAGFKAVGESVVQPLAYYDNNFVASVVLLETMTRHGVKQVRGLPVPPRACAAGQMADGSLPVAGARRCVCRTRGPGQQGACSRECTWPGGSKGI
jgi:hypothetical protein